MKSLSPEKYITNIDCIDSINCFLLFKQYIIINCKKGIALLLIKTKQIVQYIETEISENKEIILDNNDSVCILNKTLKNNRFLFNLGKDLKMKITKLNIIDVIFEPFNIYENLEINEKNIKFICINDGDFIFWGNSVYILKDEEKN